MSRNIVITGANRGIGLALVQQYVAISDSVFAICRNSSVELNSISGVTIIEGIDVTKDLDLRQLRETLGDIDIDILINNAGITQDNIFMRMKNEQWDDVLQVNLTASFRLCRGVMRGMMKRRWGRIIGITSVVGVMGNPGQANYAASKAGMIGMSKSIAQEVASRNITVNCVAPGFIATAMTDALDEGQQDAINGRIPAGRMGSPEEIAAACLYLAAPESAYVTGQTIHVNGGMIMI